MTGMQDFFNSGRRVKNSNENLSESEAETQQEASQVKKATTPRESVKKKSERPLKASQVKSHLEQEEDHERKRYPERTFDKFVQKGARLRAEDIDLLRVFCSEITRAKKDVPYEYRSNKRITDNTVIRVLVQSFCERIEPPIRWPRFYWYSNRR